MIRSDMDEQNGNNHIKGSKNETKATQVKQRRKNGRETKTVKEPWARKLHSIEKQRREDDSDHCQADIFDEDQEQEVQSSDKESSKSEKEKENRKKRKKTVKKLTSPEVKKTKRQLLNQLFQIQLSLFKPSYLPPDFEENKQKYVNPEKFNFSLKKFTASQKLNLILNSMKNQASEIIKQQNQRLKQFQALKVEQQLIMGKKNDKQWNQNIIKSKKRQRKKPSHENATENQLIQKVSFFNEQQGFYSFCLQQKKSDFYNYHRKQEGKNVKNQPQSKINKQQQYIPNKRTRNLEPIPQNRKVRSSLEQKKDYQQQKRVQKIIQNFHPISFQEERNNQQLHENNLRNINNNEFSTQEKKKQKKMVVNRRKSQEKKMKRSYISSESQSSSSSMPISYQQESKQYGNRAFKNDDFPFDMNGAQNEEFNDHEMKGDFEENISHIQVSKPFFKNIKKIRQESTLQIFDIIDMDNRQGKLYYLTQTSQGFQYLERDYFLKGYLIKLVEFYESKIKFV